MAKKKRGPGRPKGSKNKPGHKAGRPKKNKVLTTAKRGRGRPSKIEMKRRSINAARLRFSQGVMGGKVKPKGTQKIVLTGYIKND